MIPEMEKYRIYKNRLFSAVITILTVISIVPLIYILVLITMKGIGSINWDFFFNVPAPVGEGQGGISNAISGTFLLIILASFFSIPVGLLTGIFLSERAEGRFSYWVRVSADILQGIPSIVIGIIVYIWFVKQTGGFSALAGGISLAIMMLPVIIRTTQETLNLVPDSLKEASLALGVPYSITVLKVVIPAGISGIVTGILLSISRVIGEAAPLLFTAFGNPFMNMNIFKPVSAMPLIIFKYAISPFENWQNLAWGASFILIVFILVLNLFSKFVTEKWKTQF